jgi:CHAT domain-containing protein/Tfp pilus assembly protein PilF
LVINRKVLGEEHRDTVAIYNNLAITLNYQGKAAEAAHLLDKALELTRKVFGEEHPETANSYNNLGTNLQDQGKAAEAAHLLLKALEIRRKVLGEEHPETANSYNNLSMSLGAQWKMAEAAVLFQKALEIRRKVLGEEHPDTATSYNNLAVSLNAQGKAAEAAPLIQKSLEICRKVLGEDHPNTAKGYNNLAANLHGQGKVDEAAPLLLKALEIRRKVLGEDHPDTATGYNNLAANLQGQGKADEAAPLLQKAMEIRHKVLGEDHPDMATIYNNLALIRNAQGRATEVAPLLQKSLEIRRKVLGEDHRDTATSYNNLAMSLDAQGKTAEAATLFQKALEIRLKVLGEEHPETAANYKDFAVCLLDRGKVAEAAAFLRDSVFSFEASRLSRAAGIERAIGEESNPRLLLAAIEQATDPDEAWGQVERSLARGQLDQQAAGWSMLTPLEANTQAEWQTEVAALQARILALASQQQRMLQQQTELDELVRQRNKLSRRLAKLAVAASEREVASNAAIQSALPAQTALLLWIDVSVDNGVEQHFACVVRRDGRPFWVRLSGSGKEGKWTDEDQQQSAKVRSGLAQEVPPGNLSEMIQQLRSQRIEPVVPHLREHGITQLFVVGVNEMAALPVEVLAPEFAVSYLPSGTFLARMPKKPNYENTLLAVGDPIYEVKKSDPVEPAVLPPYGLLIQDAIAMGAVDKADIRAGDVLLKYGDLKIENRDQLGLAIQKAAEVGDKSVSVIVWRIGKDNKPVEQMVSLPVGPLGVVLAPEPAPLALAERRKTETIFANLNRGEDFRDLPGTRFEVSRISQLFPTANVLLDGQASERSIDALRVSGELSKFRYLHFATHGKGNNVTAFESKLILSQDQKKDEFSKLGEPWFNNEISAREVLDHWKLNADLVTLSACETGLGRQGYGDGLLGFAQAFLLKGARSVCLSLWEVDDTATALLMQRFYQNLLGQRPGLSQPMRKIDALREAKSWLKNLSTKDALEATATLKDGIDRGTRGEITIKERKKADGPAESKPYSHPQYWSAFILIGDPE